MAEGPLAPSLVRRRLEEGAGSAEGGVGFDRPGPLIVWRPGGSLFPGVSVASVYRFLLMFRNGEAADPPAFVTEEADWKAGDVFVAANGRAFRIVETAAEVEAAGMVLFDAIWTVEPLDRGSRDGRLRQTKARRSARLLR